MEADKEAVVDPRMKVMGGIVKHLKDYPFLLITIAGLVILSLVLFFDIDKLKEFKILFYAVILAPILMQFYFELRKDRTPSPPPAQTAAPASVDQSAGDQAAAPSPPTATAPSAGPGARAIASVVMSVLIFIGYADLSDEDLLDTEMHQGILVLCAISLWLGVAAFREARRQHGRTGWALTGIVLSIILGLASIGWMMTAAGMV